MDKDVVKEKETNYTGSFVMILFIALLVNLSLYKLPEKIFGMEIKKVDLFSDIRINSEHNDLLALDNDVEDVPFLSGKKGGRSKNSDDGGKTKNTADFDGESDENETKKADGKTNTSPAYNNFDRDEILNKHIEDFSDRHNSLGRFFSALNNVNKIGRPVRIAFVGDSFIEGDILVADFRAKMQEHFGGHGVGFLPVASNVSQFRPTVKQSSEGWQTYSIINNKKQKYVLSGLIFESKSVNASINFQNVDMYPFLKEVSSLKILYAQSSNTEIKLSGSRDKEGVSYQLPSSDGKMMQYEIKGPFTDAKIKFSNATGLQVVGIALEDDNGVIVDNLSLRGNSGIVMSGIDAERCHELQRIRPYDLIVLQYGLNVAKDSVREYGWYHKRMLTVIRHIQNCFPGADIMLLGVSDRSYKRGGAYTTMPAVISLLRTQRQMARDSEIAFWNIFAAMGGQNSMVQFVQSKKASKDYTHLGFEGGREIANAFYDALIREKGIYDKR